jgi:putative glycosyltransferase (TIGR04372 family)
MSASRARRRTLRSLAAAARRLPRRVARRLSGRSRIYGKPGQKRLADFAVFGVPRFGFMIVRPPRRGYGYGALLAAYLAALVYAREHRLAVYFLTRRGEPAASLRSLSAEGVHVIPPVLPVRVMMWIFWGLRLGWAQLWSRGRTRRLLKAGVAWATSLVISCIDRLARVHEALKVRAKTQPRAQPLLLRQIGGWEAVGSPPVFARVRGRNERQCRTLAASLGIDPTRPIVTLHVREAGWRSGHYKNGERGMDAVRNADFETYRPAIGFLQQHGYQAVRLGDPTMSALSDDERIVDLAPVPEADSLFELWVVSNSAFMIGADSGPLGLATLAGTPVLIVNSVHLTWGTKRPNDRFICKIAHRPGTSEPMSLAEMVAGGYLSCEVAPTVGQMDRPYRDNTPEEIVEAVEEMLSLLSTPTEQVRPTPAQLAYRKLVETHPPLVDKEGQFTLGEGQICDSFARRWLGVQVDADARDTQRETGVASGPRAATPAA